MAMDRSTPAGPSDRGVAIAHEFAIISTTLLITATLLFIARIWTRCFPIVRMLPDDYICAIAYVLVTINTALFFKSIEWTFGTWNGDRAKLTIGDMEGYTFYGVIAQPFWAWGMTAIKISIGLMLLRLEQEKRWRRFLWAMIAFQIVLSMYNMITQFVGCAPFRKMWDLSGNVPGKCWPTRISTPSQITVQVFVILTDWVFALLPISFLRKVQRPLRERVVIGILMSLGLFTGVASIIKIKQLAEMEKSGDFHAEMIVIQMWCSIEALIGFIASCVPCLRGPFQRALECVGLATVRHTNYTGHVYPGSRHATHITSGTTSVLDPPIRMKKTSSSGGESAEQILTENEAKNRGIWCTTEVRMEEEREPQATTTTHAETPSVSWRDLTSSPEPRRT